MFILKQIKKLSTGQNVFYNETKFPSWKNTKLIHFKIQMFYCTYHCKDGGGRQGMGRRFDILYNVPIQTELKLMFSPFDWMVPCWKINRISLCFLWMLLPPHNATPRTWTLEILWPVELKCCATGDPGELSHILCRCSLKRPPRFLPVSPIPRKDVGIGGRVCNRQDSRIDKWNGHGWKRQI